MTADEKLEGIKTFCLFRKAEINADQEFHAENARFEDMKVSTPIEAGLDRQLKTICHILDRCK